MTGVGLDVTPTAVEHRGAVGPEDGELLDGSPADFDNQLVYIVQTNDGQFQHLKPSEFHDRYVKRQ